MRGFGGGAATAPRGYAPAVVHDLVRQVEDARGVAGRALREAEQARRELASVRAERDALAGALADREAAEAAERRRPAPEPEGADAHVAALRVDLANVRRRRDEEIEQARASERGLGLARLSDVADDLARAVDAHPDLDSPWARGTAALLGRVRHQLRQAGAETFGAPGDRFDPTVHEAVGTDRGPAGTVVAVHRAGLRLADGSLVRPAAVVVARGPEPHDPEEAHR
jgi:molecular chaperone GrpE (heat shock protein)